MSRLLKIFTWHVHGNYLYYLSHIPHLLYVPVKAGRPVGYVGRGDSFHWPSNVMEVPLEEVHSLDLDCILFQSAEHYLRDQYEVLSERQRTLPKIYLEHDPPRESPTETAHVAKDTDLLLVHVTAFNEMMWNNGRTRTCVIEHGVSIDPNIRYKGELPRGIVVINNLASRGRRLGLDIFNRVRSEIPLDLVGMNSEELGGLGEVSPHDLPELLSHYRFLFNPIRYTSLGLAVCEAMTVGLPVIGMATTEMVNVVTNGESGYVDTRVSRLISLMRSLLTNSDTAARLAYGARRTALQRFNIARFRADWMIALEAVTNGQVSSSDQFHTAS
jgi:glycosyltransferase involved in cell wall biosynthesis